MNTNRQICKVKQQSINFFFFFTVMPADANGPERAMIIVGPGVNGNVQINILTQHGLNPPFINSFLLVYRSQIQTAVQNLYAEFLAINIAPGNFPPYHPPPPPPPPGSSVGQNILPVGQNILPVAGQSYMPTGMSSTSTSAADQSSMLNPSFINSPPSLPPASHSSSWSDIEVVGERPPSTHRHASSSRSESAIQS